MARRTGMIGLIAGLIAAAGPAATGAAASAPATPAPRNADWRAVETPAAKGDLAGYRLRVEARAGDADSPRLVVVGPRGRTLRVSANGGLVSLAEGLSRRALPVGRRLRSRYVLASSRLTTPAGEPMLIVFGHAAAGAPGSINVVAADRDGAARLVLSLAAFELAGVERRTGGGVDLIGRRSLSRSLDKCRTTYDPFAVYRFEDAAPGHYQYSLAVSRTYTLAHMPGWAGPAGREDMAVDRCNPSGGRFGTLVKVKPGGR